ncbi:MAG: PstS family phosphate ABC transporter substrate-binding protein [Acidobacteria bacterium]|nr:PstS family phosphate ABC transporter substrate-binding protein [Acidobacteriota bacterium]
MAFSSLRFLAPVAIAALVTAACGGGSSQPGQAGAPAIVTLDGSSTVFPISEAVAEEFQRANPGTRVTVGISGTGGGFQKFCRAETDISNASRPISASEIAACDKAGVGYVELPVAYDGIAIVVNPKASWIADITVAELKTLWAPEAQGKVTRWSQVRPGWPDREIHLFGAGVDSGTYDYFTEAITGKAKASRGDFTSSEDDNVLVQGVSSDELALGFLPFAYYEENQDKLKLIPVDDGNADNGAGPLLPSAESIRTGTYQPLSRPVFIYVSTKAAVRPEVQKFVDFYLAEADVLVREVSYVGLGPAAYQLVGERFAKRTTGSLFAGAENTVGVTIEQLLAKERAQ